MSAPSRRGRFRDVLSALGVLAFVSATAARGESLQSLAARDAVAQIAQAINAGEPVDGRDDDGRTALHVASKEAHLFAAMMLIAKGADPNARDRDQQTPLHLAADGERRNEGERFQIVKLLIAKGADVRARDAQGKRPMDYAKVVEFKQALAAPAERRRNGDDATTSTPATRSPRRGSP
jgi:ankyrin repeat protein